MNYVLFFETKQKKTKVDKYETLGLKDEMQFII
jgi:hypothetical protein